MPPSVRPSSALGDRIRAGRARKGLSMRQLAGLAKVSPSHLSHAERGVAPSEEALTRIAKVIGEDVDLLMHDAGRIAADVTAILLSQVNWPRFIRMAVRAGWSGHELIEMLEGERRQAAAGRRAERKRK